MKDKFKIEKGDLLKIGLETLGTFWCDSGESFDYIVPRGTVTVAMSSINQIPGWEILELDILLDNRIVTLILNTDLTVILQSPSIQKYYAKLQNIQEYLLSPKEWVFRVFLSSWGPWLQYQLHQIYHSHEYEHLSD